MRDDLRRKLRALGATDDDLERAEQQGWLPLLAFERLLMPGRRVHDLASLSVAAGIDEDTARRLWRAVGFPDVPAGVALFTDRDVEAARLALEQVTAGSEDRTNLLQQVRVISGALARVAAVEADGFADLLAELGDALPNDEDLAAAVLADERLGHVTFLIDYVHRLQLRAAIWRRAALNAAPDSVIAVGFADLSGYTRLSASLDPAALSELVGLWEAVAYDAVATSGARIVKTIGDEVMFVGLPEATLAAALSLLETAAVQGLPPLRIGVAAGPVVARDGDYFGPVVNLASRLTEAARTGQVLVPAGLRDELPETFGAELRFEDLGTRELRDIGPVGVWGVTRTG